MNSDSLLMLIPMVTGVGFFALVGWIVFVFVDGRRRREQLKAMTDFHTRALDKMGSTADFGNFLETDGGKRFLKSLTIEGPGPRQHIVRCTERGILCLVIGVVVMILGWSFGVSYRLSKNLGLLNGGEDRRSSARWPARDQDHGADVPRSEAAGAHAAVARPR